jgi:hypothetical protein
MATERTPEDAATAAANVTPQDPIEPSALPTSAASAERPEPGSRWKETVKRRGLMVGVATLIAGAITRRPAQPAEATSGGGADGTMVLGSNFISGNSPNTAGQVTVLVPGSGTFFGNELFEVDGNGGSTTTDINAIYANGKGRGAGVIGQTGGSLGQNAATLQNAGVWGNSASGASDGVYGSSSGGNGVHGLSTAASGNGVLGECNIGAAAFGVWGKSSTGLGVVGNGKTTGVLGQVGSGSGVGTVAGVEGDSAGPGAGVFGYNSGGGTGVLGSSTNGTSDTSVGV